MARRSLDRPGRRSPAGFYGWRMVALASIVGMLTGPGLLSGCVAPVAICVAIYSKITPTATGSKPSD